MIAFVLGLDERSDWSSDSIGRVIGLSSDPIELL